MTVMVFDLIWISIDFTLFFSVLSLAFSLQRENNHHTQDHVWPHFETPQSLSKIFWIVHLFFNSLLCVSTKCGQTQSIMCDILLTISACYSTRLFVWISQKGKSNDKLANIKMFDNLECVNTSVILTAIWTFQESSIGTFDFNHY